MSYETKPLGLEAIEARANAATSGPWEYDARRHGVVGPAIDADDLWNGVCNVTLTRGNHGPEKDNAEFIAHARTDVPALVAEVRRLWTEREMIADYLRDIDADFRARRPEEREVLDALLAKGGGS